MYKITARTKTNRLVVVSQTAHAVAPRSRGGYLGGVSGDWPAATRRRLAAVQAMGSSGRNRTTLDVDTPHNAATPATLPPVAASRSSSAPTAVACSGLRSAMCRMAAPLVEPFAGGWRN